jgi:hypothetical protein
LDKRIQELKTVQFWLEQNTKAVAATIQALEVQRMTLNTLKGMNMSFSDLAESLKVKPEGADASAKTKYSFTAPEAPAAEAPAEQPKAPKRKAAPKPKASHSKKQSAAGVDPSHWWGALTDQFQHIATHAMHDMANRAHAHAHAATVAPVTTSAAAAKTAAKTTSAAGKPAARKTTGRKTAVRKTATKTKR